MRLNHHTHPTDAIRERSSHTRVESILDFLSRIDRILFETEAKNCLYRPVLFYDDVRVCFCGFRPLQNRFNLKLNPSGTEHILINIRGVFGSIFQRRPSEERRRGCCREGFRNERPGAGASGHPLLYCNRGCCLMPLCHQVLPQFPRLPHFAICIFVSSRCFAQNTPVVEQMYTRQPPIACVSIDLVCMRLGCAAVQEGSEQDH